MPRRVRNVPSEIRPLDPDANPWERQPGESAKAWQEFVRYRDSDTRRVRDHGPTALAWSREWSWGYRAFEYDRFLDRQDVEDLIRYRRTMNRRHRDIARGALGKLVSYLAEMEPETMKPSDVARWLEVAVKVERVAAGAELQDGSPIPPPAPTTGEPLTVGDLLNVGDDPGAQVDVARELHAMILTAQEQNGHRDGDGRG